MGLLFFHHRLFTNFIIYNGRVYIWESKVVRVKKGFELLSRHWDSVQAVCPTKCVDVLLIMTTALEASAVSASCLGRCLTPRNVRFSFYSRLFGIQGRSGKVRKISPSPVFDARSFQPVASRYTEYAT